MAAKFAMTEIAMRPPVRIPTSTIVIAILLTANVVLSCLLPGWIWSVFATSIYVYGVWKLFAVFPAVTVLLVPFIIVQLSALVSLMVIEGGAYMPEIATAGGSSSAGASYPVFALSFLVTAALVFTRKDLSRRTLSERADRLREVSASSVLSIIPAFVLVLIVGWLLLSGLGTGFPLIEGMDRFVFRRLHANVITLNLLNLKVLVAATAAAGAVSARSRGRLLLYHVLFAGYLLSSFLYADKFFSILIATAIYCAPFVLRAGDRANRLAKRLVPVAITGLLGATLVTLFIYSDFGKRSVDEAVTKFGERVSGQGQLWYVAVRDHSSIVRFDASQVLVNLHSLVAPPPAAYFVFKNRIGPFYFVERYAPQDLYESAIHNDGWVTPTVVSEAYGLAIFGYGGLLVLTLISGLLTGLICRRLAESMISGDVFRILLPASLLTAMLGFVSQGTLYTLIGIAALKTYAAILMVQILGAMLFGRKASLPSIRRGTMAGA